MEGAVKAGDRTAFHEFIDWDAIFDRALESLGLSKQTETEYRRGAIDATRSDRGLESEIIRQAAADGSYRFLRARSLDGQPSVVFRLLSDAGVNYHEFLLSRRGGKVKAIDIYVFLSGERLSDTLRRSTLPLAERESKSWLDKLTSSESAYIKHFADISQMLRRMQAGQFEESIAIFNKLPPELQRDKNLLLMRYQTAARMGEQHAVQAVEEFRRHHPNDVCLVFLLIDYHIVRNEFPQALESIDRLDKATGGDAYLDAMRAEIVYKMGDRAKAFEHAQRAIDGNTDLANPYWTMVALAVQAKDYTRTLFWLRTIEDRFQLKIGDLGDNAFYTDFVQSPQGSEWMRLHSRGK